MTMPQRGSLTEARAFAERHAAWVGVRLTRMPQRIPLADGETIPLRGIGHRILHRPGGRGTVWIETGPEPENAPLLCVGGEAPHLARRVQDFLKREAKRDLDAAVLRHTATIRVPTRRITLRDTTSRWGSCSSTGSLNFCWRLIMAPPFVLDYLAAHEVAHLRHMNHSPRFWALTRSLSAQTEEAEAWLKAHGSGLLRFGPNNKGSGKD
jgi:predicted metal-dependent hydrolase